MYWLRIISPLVISTFYNGLWSDSRSSQFTQLCTYAPHEQQVFSHPVIIETSSVCFYAKQLTYFHLRNFQQTPHSSMKPHSLCHALLLQELLQMTTSHVAEFSCCVPCSGEHGQALKLYIALSVFMLSKHRHTVAACISTKRD